MKGRHYSKEFKTQIVKEAVEVGKAPIVARKHDLSVSMVRRWIREQRGAKTRSALPTSGHSGPLTTPERFQQRTISARKSLAKAVGD